MKITCKMCGELFLPRSKKNVFCKRRCFKLFDYKRKREIAKIPQFPSFSCPVCKNVINLTFHPHRQKKAWLKFKCPHCNVLMINVVDDVEATDVTMS